MKKYIFLLLTLVSLTCFGQAPTITFEDKDKNAVGEDNPLRKVRDVDLNEIKSVVNEIASLIDALEASKQPIDSDITALSGLAPSNDDIIQRKAGAWVNRTLAQIKADLSINNVDNTSDANKPVSTAQLTALNLKANLASPTFTGTVSGITKTMVGLGNADNTSDVNKPVSTATQNALNLKTTTTNFATRVTPSGTVNGVNLIFVIPQVPVDGSDQVFVNGLLQVEGTDYTRSTDTFTFAEAPETGDVIKINYIRP